MFTAIRRNTGQSLTQQNLVCFYVSILTRNVYNHFPAVDMRKLAVAFLQIFVLVSLLMPRRGHHEETDQCILCVITSIA